jgi:hypothetical protein
MLQNERRRFLATVGRRSAVQGLERREVRRYPILLALVAQSAVDQLDEVIALFDQAVSARESHAKAKMDEALAERAKKGEARHQRRLGRCGVQDVAGRGADHRWVVHDDVSGDPAGIG